MLFLLGRRASGVFSCLGACVLLLRWFFLTPLASSAVENYWPYVPYTTTQILGWCARESTANGTAGGGRGQNASRTLNAVSEKVEMGLKMDAGSLPSGPARPSRRGPLWHTGTDELSPSAPRDLHGLLPGAVPRCSHWLRAAAAAAAAAAAVGGRSSFRHRGARRPGCCG